MKPSQTISARIRATVLAGPLTRDQIVAIVGGNRKARLHYIAKLLDRGMLVRVGWSGGRQGREDALIGPGRDPYIDFKLTDEEKAIRLKARNAKHNALKRERRLAAGMKPRQPAMPIEERRARQRARDKARREAKRAARPPKPSKAPRVRAKVAPAPRPAQAVRKPKPPGLIDCAKATPPPVTLPTTAGRTLAELAASGIACEVLPGPRYERHTVMPVGARYGG